MRWGTLSLRYSLKTFRSGSKAECLWVGTLSSCEYGNETSFLLHIQRTRLTPGADTGFKGVGGGQDFLGEKNLKYSKRVKIND